MTNLDNKRITKSRSGFTLVEVAVALAIFSSTLLLLFLSLPQSLDNMNDASSTSLQRRIAQNLVGEIMLSDWATIHDFSSTGNNLRFYDAQGIPTREFDDLLTIFTARIRILPRDVNIDQDRSLEGLTLPPESFYTLPDDETVLNSTSQHARRIIIEVTNVPVDDFDFDDPENANSIVSMGTLVANLNEADSN